MKISLFSGGNASPHYVLGLTSGLSLTGIKIDFIGSDIFKGAQILNHENITFYNLRGDQDPSSPIWIKITRIIKFYYRMMKYAAKTDSEIFHIQWLNKFALLDSTLLNIYYRLLGKKLIFTAHNINAGQRDDNDSIMNRLSLKNMYKFVDHIIVHTEKMKQQLISEFAVGEHKISVIPHGILNIAPITNLKKVQAREKFDIQLQEKILLFFGIIAPYKGLEFLIPAFKILREKYSDMRLIIAGKIENNYPDYWMKIEELITENSLANHIIKKTEFIPDKEVEFYFKSSDILILPYKYIFQTGVLFLSYNFGLPAIVSDVGSLREEVIEGKTGYVFNPEDATDLANKIDEYFTSDLYYNLEANRINIIKFANDKYSWEKIGEKTVALYMKLTQSK